MFGDSAFDPARAISYTPFEEQLTALHEAQTAGMVAAWGVSNETAWGLAKWCSTARQMGVAPPAVVQNAHNLLCRTAEASVLEACHEEGVRFDAYSPLAMGLLTGKYSLSSTAAQQEGTVPTFSRSSEQASSERAPAWTGPAESRLMRYRNRYAEAESRCASVYNA